MATVIYGPKDIELKTKKDIKLARKQVLLDPTLFWYDVVLYQRGNETIILKGPSLETE